MKILFRLLASFAFCLAPMWVQASTFDEMVRLDRAYVPALALTNQAGKDVAAKAAMGKLTDAWAVFNRTVAADRARDALLAKVMDSSAKQIADANRLALAGDLPRAHEALESLRQAFWKWRVARGIEYFPDALTAFHDEMEHLVELGAKRADRDTQRTSFAGARSRWVDVERARFEPSRYGFDAAKRERLAALMAKERALLDDYAIALAAGEPSALAAAGKALKGNFAQIYFLFGEFGGS